MIIPKPEKSPRSNFFKRLISSSKGTILYILFFFSLGLSNAISQNIYDYENSRGFVNHLLNAGQFEQSIIELERLLFISPANDTLHFQLIMAYRKAGKFDQGIARTAELYPQLFEMPLGAAYEYGKFFMDQTDYLRASAFWQGAKAIPATDKRVLLATTLALQTRFSSALQTIDSLRTNDHPLIQPYRELFGEAARLRWKSPVLAGVMSGIIPASGRFYAHDWKDGLFSLLFISTSAWQSYRGFRKNGVESVRGWIFGGFTAGFYLGNIYGSAKAARRYNDVRQEKYLFSTKQLFQSYY